jgi:hypothetical protein
MRILFVPLSLPLSLSLSLPSSASAVASLGNGEYSVQSESASVPWCRRTEAGADEEELSSLPVGVRRRRVWSWGERLECRNVDMRLLISRVWFCGEMMFVVVGDIFETDGGCWSYIMTLRDIELARRTAAAACVNSERYSYT